jgi:DNA-binding GntR family transcriptional regulator
MRRKSEFKNLNFISLQTLQVRKSLGEQVFNGLKQGIMRGDISAGGRLVESHIAETLGISRTPVREAIHKLEREGFIEHQPRGGFKVLALSRNDIEETFGIRSVLEGYAARLATIKHRTEELKPLENKIEEFRKRLDKNQLDVLTRINTEFHNLLYALSKSPKLINMINSLQDQIYRFRLMILSDDKLAAISNDDHKRMLKLIQKRDADGVERLVREHILRGQEVVLKEFDREKSKWQQIK